MKMPFLMRLRLALAILLSSHAVDRLIADSQKMYVDVTNRRQRRAIARHRRSAKPRKR